MDSRATRHVTRNKVVLYSLKVLKGGTITVVGGESYKVKGIDNASVTNSSREIKLDNVLYVPSVRKSLMTVGKLVDVGHIVVFS